jgi:aconitate decarboxylase
MQDAIEAFADHVIATKTEDIPDAARLAAKTYILDTIGVGLAGSGGPYVPELLKVHSGDGPSRVLGQKARLAPADAALLNGYQIHNSEFDCVHEKAVIHTMTVLMAALLAEADRRGGIDGESLIRASVLGVDVACNLGVACSTGLQFFRPATAGAFAAIAAMGAVRGYDKDTLLKAFALGYSQLCGTMQAHTEGSPILALQIGFNARNALSACDMAEHGLPGLKGVLEGPFGYFGLFEKAGDIRSVLPTLGEVWRITEVAHKPFPSGRATHGIVDAIQELRREHAIDAGAVARVEARVPSLTNHLVGRPVHDAMEINYARLNGRYAAAVMLSRGFIGIEDFTLEAVRMPERVALARKVSISIDGNPDPNALSPVEVDIHMVDGQVHSKRIDTVYGNPAKPMTRDAHLTKFRRNWAAAACGLKPVDAEVMINRVDTLETVPDIRELIDLATV